jgi:hypothetical protein
MMLTEYERQVLLNQLVIMEAVGNLLRRPGSDRWVTYEEDYTRRMLGKPMLNHREEDRIT